MKLLYRWQRPWTIWSESCVWTGYPSGLTDFVIFGQCRQWSRKNQQRTVTKQRKHKQHSWVYCATNTIGFLSRFLKQKSHSWFMFSEPITVRSKTKNKKTKQYQIPCKSLWKLVYWQSFYQNIRPAMIGENEEILQKCEVWKRWRKSLQFSDMIISRCASLQK